ncbi:MAG: ribosomal RNA small subunit methyltransferase A [Candidatus Atribacteria bacterium]|nr:ribosomal RNA small subunit methyltransferase A [Candidatus Atribacteria bacterium]
MHETVKLSQNFLMNTGVLEKIIDFSDLTQGDCVVEIGAGRGNLTRQLALYSGEVFAFEVDPILYQRTRKELSLQSNIHFFNQDFLKVDLFQILTHFSNSSFKVVSNIPYHVSTPILFKLVQIPIPFEMLVLMVQKEFYQKIIAQPGEKRRVPLSVVFQMRYQVKQRFEVSRGSFRPMPRVDSVILKCLPRSCSPNVATINRVANLAQVFFQQKRKKISNLLRPFIDPEIIQITGISITKRPEDLTNLEWLKLSEVLNKSKEKEV